MRITIEGEIALDIRDGNKVTVENVGNNTIVIVLEINDKNKQQLWDSQRFINCQQTKSIDKI